MTKEEIMEKRQVFIESIREDVYCLILKKEITPVLCLTIQGTKECFGCAAPSRFCKVCLVQPLVTPEIEFCLDCLKIALAKESQKKPSYFYKWQEVDCLISKNYISIETCRQLQGLACGLCGAISRLCLKCKKQVYYLEYGLCLECAVQEFAPGNINQILDKREREIVIEKRKELPAKPKKKSLAGPRKTRKKKPLGKVLLGHQDPYLRRAREIICQKQKAGIAFLMHYFPMDYQHAKFLLEALEDQGIVKKNSNRWQVTVKTLNQRFSEEHVFPAVLKLIAKYQKTNYTFIKEYLNIPNDEAQRIWETLKELGIIGRPHSLAQKCALLLNQAELLQKINDSNFIQKGVEILKNKPRIMVKEIIRISKSLNKRMDLNKKAEFLQKFAETLRNKKDTKKVSSFLTELQKDLIKLKEWEELRLSFREFLKNK